MTQRRIHLTPEEAAAKGFRCRTHLKAARLMPKPGARPAGSVWQGQGAYYVYNSADCEPWRWTPGPAQLRRRSIAAQAHDLISAECVVLDTETTGLGHDDEICEIAIVDVTGAPILDTLVRPTRPIPAEATEIHGITDEMVASAPSWPELAERFEAAVSGRKVVAYNALFDQRLVWQTYERHGRTAPQMSTACAMKMYAVWHGEWNHRHQSWTWQKLVDAATECGSAGEGAHRALADARMALGVLRYLQRCKNGRRLPLAKARFA